MSPKFESSGTPVAVEGEITLESIEQEEKEVVNSVTHAIERLANLNGIDMETLSEKNLTELETRAEDAHEKAAFWGLVTTFAALPGARSLLFDGEILQELAKGTTAAAILAGLMTISFLSKGSSVEETLIARRVLEAVKEDKS
ncbi:MAG: hypothetical protein ACI9VM_000225 [Candidatus Azotimanducaceae bacterium]|jgi:hypothetical protein